VYGKCNTSHRGEYVKRKHYGWSALAGLLATLFVAASIVSASAASATPSPSPTAQRVCPEWDLHSTVDNKTWIDPPSGATVAQNKVTLVKPANGGTEFATQDAGLTFDTPVDIKVDYDLSGGASYAAGAIRLFYYEDTGNNTLVDAPASHVAANAESGTLIISGVNKVGTLGFTYDGSNPAGGSVTFTNLIVGDTQVRFKKGACVDPTTAPPTTPPATTQPPASGEPSSDVTETPAPGVAGGGELPVTGSAVATLSALGGILLLGGLATFFLARQRRRPKFTS
jgi:LPXTG-motif cell wall-anchored protein